MGHEVKLTDNKDIENWVYCYFEQVGKIIVLENGGTCKCPEGQFIWNRDGRLSDVNHFFFNDGKMMDDGQYSLDKECNVWADGFVPEMDKDIHAIIGTRQK